jgi:hypothetical protein
MMKLVVVSVRHPAAVIKRRRDLEMENSELSGLSASTWWLGHAALFHPGHHSAVDGSVVV